jgi:hypothetical protein
MLRLLNTEQIFRSSFPKFPLETTNLVVNNYFTRLSSFKLSFRSESGAPYSTLGRAAKMSPSHFLSCWGQRQSS